MKACLILKPEIIRKRKIADYLSHLESQGCRVIDIMALALAPEDLYDFFQLQIKYPTLVEIKSFRPGTCVIIGFSKWIDYSSVVKKASVYYSPNEEVGEVDCRFWFGGS